MISVKVDRVRQVGAETGDERGALLLRQDFRQLDQRADLALGGEEGIAQGLARGRKAFPASALHHATFFPASAARTDQIAMAIVDAAVHNAHVLSCAGRRSGSRED